MCVIQPEVECVRELEKILMNCASIQTSFKLSWKHAVGAITSSLSRSYVECLSDECVFQLLFFSFLDEFSIPKGAWNGWKKEEKKILAVCWCCTNALSALNSDVGVSWISSHAPSNHSTITQFESSQLARLAQPTMNDIIFLDNIQEIFFSLSIFSIDRRWREKCADFG